MAVAVKNPSMPYHTRVVRPRSRQTTSLSEAILARVLDSDSIKVAMFFALTMIYLSLSGAALSRQYHKTALTKKISLCQRHNVSLRDQIGTRSSAAWAARIAAASGMRSVTPKDVDYLETNPPRSLAARIASGLAHSSGGDRWWNAFSRLWQGTRAEAEP